MHIKHYIPILRVDYKNATIKTLESFLVGGEVERRIK